MTSYWQDGTIKGVSRPDLCLDCGVPSEPRFCPGCQASRLELAGILCGLMSLDKSKSPELREAARKGALSLGVTA